MIVAEDQQTRKLIEQAKRYARFDVPILLHGESGTGKEVLAKFIHAQSRLAGEPLVRINCAALTETPVLCDLFTQDSESLASLNSAAEQKPHDNPLCGTIFFDEIGEVPETVQAHLCCLISNHEFGSREVPNSNAVGVRIISSTSRDLGEAADSGTFRVDLLHRINAAQMKLPPLRDRAEDIEVLTQQFIVEFNQKNNVQIQGLTKEAKRVLRAYNWPGNIRQLRNVIHCACIDAKNPIVSHDDLPISGSASFNPNREEKGDLPIAWRDKNLEEIERDVILENIQRLGSHRNAAEHLGISVRTLTNKMRKYRQDDRRAA